MGRWRCGARLARETVSVATLYQIPGRFSSAQGEVKLSMQRQTASRLNLEAVGTPCLLVVRLRK